jgi:uncharacterized protein YggU (UPF0235/DUF167 family)
LQSPLKVIDLFHQLLPERLNVRVTPKASSNRLKIEYGENGITLVRVYVTVPAEDGKANEAVIALLAKELGVAKSTITILQGFKTRDKVLKIGG